LENGGESLEVRENQSNRVLHETFSARDCVRVAVDPSFKELSFFTEDPGTHRRRLFIWQFSQPSPAEALIPESYSHPLIKWSRDGRYLAFSSDNSGFTIIDTHRSNRLVVAIHRPIRSFDWSPESDRIAFVDKRGKERSSLSIMTLSTGDIRPIDVQYSGVFQDIAWGNARNILVSTHEKVSKAAHPSEEYSLFLVTLNEKQCERLHASKMPIRFPSWIPDGSGVIWHEREPDGMLRLHSRRFHERSVTSFPSRASSELTGFSADSSHLVVKRISTVENEFCRMNLDNPPETTTLIGSEGKGGILSWKKLPKSGSDGKEIVVSVSKPRSDLKGLIIRMHGGPNPLFDNIWPETQLFLSYGLLVVNVPNDHSTGAADLANLGRTLAQEYGIPASRTMIIGESSSAGLVLETALLDPEFLGAIAIVGVLEPHMARIQRPQQLSQRIEVLAFHGEFDNISSPDNIHRGLVEILGAERLTPPNGLWYVFKNEGHSLREDSSLAIFYSTLLNTLGLLDTERFRSPNESPSGPDYIRIGVCEHQVSIKNTAFMFHAARFLSCSRRPSALGVLQQFDCTSNKRTLYEHR